MKYEIIQNIVEDLSLEFVLLDSSEPEGLSALLPILDSMEEEIGPLSEGGPGEELLGAQKGLKDIIGSASPGGEEKFEMIDKAISEIKSLLHNYERSDKEKPVEPNKQVKEKINFESGETTGGKYLEAPLEAAVEGLSGFVAGFCRDRLPDCATMLTLLDQLIVQSNNCGEDILREVAGACKNYVGRMTLETMHDTKPIEDGLVLLKSILSHLKRGEPFSFDYSDVMDSLAIGFTEEENSEESGQEVNFPELDEGEEPEEILQDERSLEDVSRETAAPEKISEDDLEILVDFVSEAEENLDTIEVNLIELEQDPSNKDIINEIFRPFHTIKGVSGFLALKKINTLSHTTENLLDSARSGEFLINDVATDVILESVDTLKKLIAGVKQGTATGFMPPDDDIDVDNLKDKLQKLQVALTKGEKMPLGEILVQKGEISKESLDHALEIQKAAPERKIGEILVQEKKTAPKKVAAALMEQNVNKKPVATQVKVSTQKLDDLVDYAGELVIAQSMLRQKTSDDQSLSQSVAQLGLIVTNMQNIAMSMRMIPIKATFMKMIRLVRDLSRKSGKDIALNMIGEDTEIDRNVVDALYEPMVHMIRNSCDHGIEPTPDRLGNGKPSQGTITLRAYHKGGSILIEIEDDGKGLDKEIILEKAKKTGLITTSDQMTDAQIYDLVLQPGFSTAKEITDVSGRGVGMDVVKSGIEKFRGQLNIESTKGVETKFTISLPLTLAIIDGMLVGVENERYVIPTIAIQKAFKPDKDECFTVEGKGEMVKDRGSLIPVIRLNEIYNNESRKKPIWENLVVVVESKDEKRALLIDELLGKDEYVIKSLGSSFEDIKSIAGGAILSDGRVGLILDVHGIFTIVNG